MTSLTINVNDGTNNVDLNLNYTWWPGTDSWSAASPGYVGANSGTWFYGGIGGVHAFQISGVPAGRTSSRLILTLRNGSAGISDLRVGDSGTGFHNISGVIIDVAPVEWTITAIV